MRSIVFVAVLSGCSSVAGPAGPAGPKGDPGEGADPSMTMALLQRIADLEAKAKQPHLIAVDSGDDLGPFVDWAHAWSEPVGVYYRTTPRALVAFADENCEGEPMAGVGDGVADRYVAGSNDQIMELVGAPRDVLIKAARDVGECLRYPQPYMAKMATARDTGAVAVIRDRFGLRVELR
jgi:hypothetical protein